MPEHRRPHVAGHNQLSLTSSADDSTVGADVSVSLGLIVTELVINSLKHAFPVEGRAGAINVDILSKGGGGR